MLTVGTTCAIVSMHPSFPTPGWRKLRATVFVGMGVFSFFPIMHGVYIYGFWGVEERMGLRWSLLQGVLYVVGTAIFALCVPERWYPGRFDLVGASHQIMHFCALSAAAAELTALVAAFDYMHARGGEVC
jgi:adiponectin receptor